MMLYRYRATTSCTIFSMTLISHVSHANTHLDIKSYLAGVDANMDCGAIGLLTLHTLDVNDVLLPVDLDNFANLLAFVVSPDNLVKRGKKVSKVTPSKVTRHFNASDCNIEQVGKTGNVLTWTSSSLRMGMDLTLYFWRSSLDRGEDMIFLRMCEGALKCLLRFLRREEVTNLLSFMMAADEKGQ